MQDGRSYLDIAQEIELPTSQRLVLGLKVKLAKIPKSLTKSERKFNKVADIDKLKLIAFVHSKVLFQEYFCGRTVLWEYLKFFC